MAYETAGDPITGTKWARTTPQRIADILKSRGFAICRNTVATLIAELGFSLKKNRKQIATSFNPDRNQQFEVIRRLRESFEVAGDPIISVDTKKKELVGLFANGGRVWTREPILTNDHDFRSDAIAIAVPYGIYDVLNNAGTVIVGTSADTPEFAVHSISTWWRYCGRYLYGGKHTLLILADSGGSNGCRPRAWKYELQEFVDRSGLTVTVAHYPSGASKWNPIEHRLFSEISKNWAGRPLDTVETMLNYIQTTRTTAGLDVRSYRDARTYEKGVKVSDAQMEEIHLEAGQDLPQWSYTIRPRVSA